MKKTILEMLMKNNPTMSEFRSAMPQNKEKPAEFAGSEISDILAMLPLNS